MQLRLYRILSRATGQKRIFTAQVKNTFQFLHFDRQGILE